MNKGKERKKREGKQKKGVGIGVKIVALLLLLAVAALSCMGVLVQTLQSVIVTNDEIVGPVRWLNRRKSRSFPDSLLTLTGRC